MTAVVEDRYGVEAPATLDDVDLCGGCPSCGHDDAPVFIENPAGYYTCEQCFSTWAGEFRAASLVQYLAPDNGGGE